MSVPDRENFESHSPAVVMTTLVAATITTITTYIYYELVQ